MQNFMPYLSSVLRYLCLATLLYSCEREDLDILPLPPENIPNTYNSKMANLTVSKSDWMSQLSDKTFLKNITLVGSEGSLAIDGTNALTRQSEGLLRQLEEGVRLFDFELKTSDETGDEDFYVSDQDNPIKTKVNMPGFAQLLVPPRYGESIRFYKHVLPVLENFVATHQTEVLFIFVHKSVSSNEDKFDQIMQKIMQKRVRLHNVFGAGTTLGTVRNQILVMQLYDQNGNTYIKHNNERVIKSVNQSVSRKILRWEINPYTGNPIRPLNIDWDKQNYGDFDWKLKRIYQAIHSAYTESLKNHFFITYTSGWSSSTSPSEVADNILTPTTNYIDDHIINLSAPFLAQRSGFLLANFVTSDKGKKLIDVCIKQSVLNNGKTNSINSGVQRWISNE